jgi:hypothetical protein
VGLAMHTVGQFVMKVLTIDAYKPKASSFSCFTARSRVPSRDGAHSRNEVCELSHSVLPRVRPSFLAHPLTFSSFRGIVDNTLTQQTTRI